MQAILKLQEVSHIMSTIGDMDIFATAMYSLDLLVMAECIRPTVVAVLIFVFMIIMNQMGVIIPKSV